MLWRVHGQQVQQVEQTILADQELLEHHLEAWIESNPAMLGEPLLIVGRQVPVPGINDRLDLLALDPSGNTVIIEVKRGELKDPVDMQALRYASYISRWPRRKIEQLAEAYHAQHGDPETGASFDEIFTDFASETEEVGVPSLNGKQRVIIVGHRLQARLGSVALWLLQQGIDIKIVEVTPYKDPSGNGLLLSPQIIIPPPSTEDFEIGGTEDPNDPWVIDGQKWHLEHRCKERGRQILRACIKRVGDRYPGAQGPFWNQKQYVSFRLDSGIWLYLNTRATQLNLTIPVPPGKWDGQALAARLRIGLASKDDSLSEKLAAPTSVRVRKRKGNERLDFFIKDDALLASDEFWKVIDETYADFAKGW
jgi:Holliday junction resolvase-like predicted endonuclease